MIHIRVSQRLLDQEPTPAGPAQRTSYLFSGAVWLVQVDHDLALTRTERVHGEHRRTQHSVSRRLDTCTAQHEAWFLKASTQSTELQTEYRVLHLVQNSK